MGLVKLYEEKDLVVELQTETVGLIRHCSTVDPIKKLVNVYDILKLTLDIANKFPRTLPDLPECDEGALLYMETLTRELVVYHRLDLPTPEFPRYLQKVQRLFRLYHIPRGKK